LNISDLLWLAALLRPMSSRRRNAFRKPRDLLTHKDALTLNHFGDDPV
jgi:hypothetical protein